MNVVDPVAYEARLARERAVDERVAAIAAAEQKKLDDNGEKICLNDKTCAATIPADATRCPECGRNQGQSGSGRLSGARRRGPIVLNFGGAR